MAGIPFWADDSVAWEQCQLGEDLLPGVAEVTIKTQRDVDKKKSKGKDGCTLTDNGAPPAEGKIVLTIWNKYHWDEWQRIRPKIDPRKAGGLKVPLTIVHPEAADAGVDVVYVQEIEATPPRKAGARTITLSIVQWFPEPKDTKTGKPDDTYDRRYREGVGAIPLDAVEGLPGLRNPDGSVMDLAEGRENTPMNPEKPAAAKGPSQFDRFGFGSKEPGTG